MSNPLDLEKKIRKIRDHVNEYPDFPKPGVLFRDVFSVFQNAELVAMLREVLIAFATQIQPPVECVVGIDARGFLLAPFIALELEVPFVPVRKKGKLPGKVASVSYALEYGEANMEIQESSIKEGQRVLIVDDLLATGGSLGAACTLVKKLGGVVEACLVLMELSELKGRLNVPTNVISIIKY
ncbi:hypothetical protein Zmor_016841 [Zophobas morio]|uniref:Adenine phosphoribosyltransferase n=1 Tax=Zophobas morio TaxID=2755281 RepID=A0AA38I8A5_9CUCU|nr:hypothetical protein Zmor_016841 [Zophobas morio]